MADTDDLISSLYPPPPPYVRFFTKENLAKLDEWKASLESNDEPRDQNDSIAAPPPGELRFLVPPQPPAGSHYRGYGNLWSFEDKLPSLKEMGLRQLYPDDDDIITSKTKIKELHKLLDSLLLNFLELVGVVSVQPEKFHLKIEDLKLILININHILNSYRPHQSRESLIMLLRKQIEAKRSEIVEIDRVRLDVKEKIAATLSGLTNKPSRSYDQSSESLLDGSTDASIEATLNEITTKLLN